MSDFYLSDEVVRECVRRLHQLDRDLPADSHVEVAVRDIAATVIAHYKTWLFWGRATNDGDKYE